MDIEFYEKYSALVDDMDVEISKKMGIPLSLLVKRTRIIPQDKKFLTRVQSTIMAVLYWNSGIVMSELAKKCGLSFKNISAPVKALEKIGYVRREVDAKNKKYVHVYMTDISNKIWQRVENVGTELSKTIFEKNLTDQQLAELFNATKVVRDYYKQMPQVLIGKDNDLIFD